MSYTAEDFRGDTPPRVTRSLSSYTSGIFTPDLALNDRLPQDVQTYEETAENPSRQTLWLGNGGMVSFVKNNNVIEYSTPEVSSAIELLMHERAGEDLVAKVGAQALGTLSSDLAPASRSIVKRTGYGTVEIGGEKVLSPMSLGHYESYWTSLNLPPINGVYESFERQALNSFLVSRVILTGAGMMTSQGFEVSQKAHDVSFYSTSMSGVGIKRAFSNFNVANGLSELEIRLGEGNMSAWTIVNKHALTSLVLRLIEHGQFPPHLLVRKTTASEAMRRVSRRQPIETESGPMSSATHLRHIVEAASRFAEQFDYIPEEEKTAAEEAIVLCKLIEAFFENEDELSPLADQLDWAAKLLLMRDKEFVKTVNIDLRWEDISSPNSLSRKWYQTRSPLNEVADRGREAAQLLPPITRALARTSLLAMQAKKPVAIGWNGVQYPDDILFRLTDPYETVAPTQPLRLRRR